MKVGILSNPTYPRTSGLAQLICDALAERGIDASCSTAEREERTQAYQEFHHAPFVATARNTHRMGHLSPHELSLLPLLLSFQYAAFAPQQSGAHISFVLEALWICSRVGYELSPF